MKIKEVFFMFLLSWKANFFHQRLHYVKSKRRERFQMLCWPSCAWHSSLNPLDFNEITIPILCLYLDGFQSKVTFQHISDSLKLTEYVRSPETEVSCEEKFFNGTHLLFDEAHWPDKVRRRVMFFRISLYSFPTRRKFIQK